MRTSTMASAEALSRSLADYAEDARELPADDFGATHGRAFLLHHGPIGKLEAAARPQTTVLVEGAESTGAKRALPPQLDFLVFPVRHTGRSPFPNFVSVGRTSNNDIVINDVSVSKFQAFFRANDGGELELQDAGSANGTFVDGRAVPPKDRGEPIALENGARLKLGAVEVTFLTAESLQLMVRRAL